MKFILALILSILFPALLLAAPVHDATTTHVNLSAGSTATQSATTSGTNRYMSVCVHAYGGVLTTGVTYNGVSMTKIGEENPHSSSNATLWGLTNPASGANDVVVTFDFAG